MKELIEYIARNLASNPDDVKVTEEIEEGRVVLRLEVAEEDKGAFQMSAPARGLTPETAALAGGEEEAETLEDALEAEEAEDAADQARSTRTDPTE